MAVTSMVPEPLATLSAAAAQQWATANGTWIKLILDAHSAWLTEAEVEKHQAAYDGYLESIDLRDKSRGDDTNNKLYVNLAGLVIDTVVDYMVAKPPTWTVENADLPDAETKEPEIVTEYRKKLLKLLRTEQGQRVMAEQLRQGSIAGYSCIIAWVNEKGKIDYEEFPVQEVIPVYDTRGRLILVLRYYEMEVPNAMGSVDTYKRVEVYDDRYVTYYRSEDIGEGYILDDVEDGTANPIEHKAGRIPVSIFINGTPARYAKRLKKAGTSDLGNGVFSLLEAYAAGVSDKANLAEYLQDQYLALTGVDVDEKEVLKMRKARAIALKNKDSTAEFIAQSQEDKTVENYLDRVENLIYDMTLTPKLKDLSGATATEVRMKYVNLDIKASKKETYYTDSTNQFVAVLTDLLNAELLSAKGIDSPYDILSEPGVYEKRQDLYNPEWVQFTFNRNLPQNHKEIADIVAELAGIAPDSYLLELLWFVDDPVAALAEMKKQKADEAKANLDAMGFGGEFGNTSSAAGAAAGSTGA